MFRWILHSDKGLRRNEAKLADWWWQDRSGPFCPPHLHHTPHANTPLFPLRIKSLFNMTLSLYYLTCIHLMLTSDIYIVYHPFYVNYRWAAPRHGLNKCNFNSYELDAVFSFNEWYYKFLYLPWRPMCRNSKPFRSWNPSVLIDKSNQTDIE